MERLAGVLARRRWLIVAVWAVVLVAALPLAARQTEDLTGGGFAVPGSQSEEVDEAIESEYGGTSDGAISVVLHPASAQIDSGQAAAGVERMTVAVAEVPDLTLPSGADSEAQGALEAGDVVVVPLRTDLPTDQQTDAASDLREELSPGDEGSEERRVGKECRSR